ncbi:Flagellar basal body-associated protein FliL [Butyrivibrio sp. INlla18]|jgi:flagellar FliL protein|uniref:flagellar basal body-associated FliL family protein n=1 Tax=unclassified Butyrivibrio TaxID=2639466 RepID=UPI000886684D|nr:MULTISPECIES: flagellar basal body-associated FliL family protein [unclassified Butyrivibrio]MBE5840187.1 flagellar basal body-associated FliL family protein [Butyrivibrio sp.]SDA64204.1 Flagellar basal body-associated protein FliL [Butyrivibrio sp. INlla18]
MKKNLLSIIILALLVINLAMNGFMLLSVMTTNSQTAKLISDIAAALELEASGGAGGGFSNSNSGTVGVANIATFGYTGDNNLTISLKPGADGKTHYMLADVVFSMNTAAQDYATYGSSESLASMSDLVKAKVIDVLSSYTMEELQADMQTAKDQVLEAVQELYGSNFIYDVSISAIYS